MLLISWNVAGLSTTLQRIHRDYSHCNSKSNSSNGNVSSNTKTTTAGTNSSSAAFITFLERHGNPDILCIQEHKIPHSKLSTRSEPFQISSCLPNYESFWSCCTDKSKKGFNGVVTIVKKGLTTQATSTPFQNESLDSQGRCVMTDHESFVVFNVYAPATGGRANSLSDKMTFLKQLQICVRRQKSKGKKVFVVGDLNICYDKIDKHWTYRSIHVDSVLDEVLQWQQTGQTKYHQHHQQQQWKIDLANHWPTIQNSLSTIVAVPVTTKNIATGTTFEKYRAQVTIQDSTNTKNNKGRKNIFIGKAESTKEDCLSQFHFPQCTYYDQELDTDVICRQSNVVPINTLYELMSKIVNIEWGSNVLSCISNFNHKNADSVTSDIDNNNTNSDGLKHVSPQAKWLDGLLKDDDMVDPFRLLYPLAKERFTCWDQSKNSRFDNIGIRIDYTLHDKSLTKYIDTKNIRLRCCNYSPNKDFNTEEAALHAATASGQYQGASFEGGGIVDPSQSALDSQFGEPHTGIIYTPPSYSDHVAVSLLLNDEWDKNFVKNTLQLDSKCGQTKKSQPHKSQSSISSFFGKGNNMNSSNKATTNVRVDESNNQSKGENKSNSVSGKLQLNKTSSITSSTSASSSTSCASSTKSSSMKKSNLKRKTNDDNGKGLSKKGTLFGYFVK